MSDTTAKIEALQHAAAAVRQIPRPRGAMSDELTKIQEELERRAEKLKTADDQKAEASERGFKFADWFKGTLPAEAVLVKGWREQWAKCFDAMMEKDGRTDVEIFRVCTWARAERFWSGNFLSPMKLRKRDGNQAMFFDRFLAEMEAEKRKQRGGTSGAAAVAEGKQFAEPGADGTGLKARVLRV